MTVQKFDELNILTTSQKRSIPYEEYFGEMGLGEKEIERRIDLAKQFELIIIGFFFTVEYLTESISWDTEEQRLYEDFVRVSNKYVGAEKPTAYIDDMSRTLAYELVKGTKKHMNDSWYTSVDRAIFNAENNANFVGEYKQYVDAVKQGKTRKTWHTIVDNRRRKSHADMEGKTIPINDTFTVGYDSKMLFPTDMTYNADLEEIINCRCWCTYHN